MELLADQALIGKSIEIRGDGIRGFIKGVNLNRQAFVTYGEGGKWTLLVPIDKIKHSRGQLFTPKERKRKGDNHATGS